MRVLVVDDFPLTLRAFETMLTYSGHEVLTANCVADAAELIATLDHLDAAVLEVQLPDGLGFDLVEPLRAHRELCGIVMMASHIQEEFTRRADKLGVGQLLQKPFRVADLLKAIAIATSATTLSALL